MAILAVRLTMVKARKAIATATILVLGNEFEMDGVTADAITAKMVQFPIFLSPWQGMNQPCVHNTMGWTYSSLPAKVDSDSMIRCVSDMIERLLFGCVGPSETLISLGLHYSIKLFSLSQSS